MKPLVLFILALVFLTGCASTDYDSYAKAQGDIARANAEAQRARYDALSKVAETGSESSRIAAVMALAFSSGTGSQAVQQVQAPQASAALQWAQVLVPSITNIAGLHYASRASIASAESAATVAKSTNEAFVGIAGKIQAPITVVPQTIAPVLPQANVSTVTTTTNNANQANVTTTSSANQANTTTSTANPTTVTLSGAGVVGSGTSTIPTTTTTTTTNPAAQIPAGTVCAVSATGTLDCKP